MTSTTQYIILTDLRLSRPSLSLQHPLPTPSIVSESPSIASSYAYPRIASDKQEDSFILAPVLTLPQTFGSAYVGETFSCTLCANNELPLGGVAGVQKQINNVRIEAEMKIPSSSAPVPLTLGPTPSNSDEKAETQNSQTVNAGVTLKDGESLQRIISFELREEGSHVLAVTVSYSETTSTSGRVRTFRKLYQFVSKGCMIVRTKSGLLPTGSKDGRKRWALEAQLENAGDEGITLEDVSMNTEDNFKALGLNGSFSDGSLVLMPGDVQQVCFLVENAGGGEKDALDGRVIFGTLHIEWRGQMGNKGYIDTGKLGARLK